MRRTLAVISLILAALALLGAIGQNPGYVEELVIGGGITDPIDGGAHFEDDGTIVTTGKISAGAATTSSASLALPHGTSPSSPANGDLWTTSAGLFVRVNGSTVGPLIHAAGIPWAAPGAIGATTPNTGAFTSLSATGDLTVGGQVLESGNFQGVSTEALIALWHCESLSPMLDWTGNGNTGTIAGSGAALASGKFGTGINFGANSEANFGNAIPLNHGASDLSVTLWFKSSATNATMYLMRWFIDSNRRFDLWMNGSGAISARMKENANDRQITSSNGYNDGKWHFLTFVRDYTSASDNSLTLYIDGVQTGTPLTGVALGNCGGNAGLVCSSQSGFGFPGTLDDIQMLARSLSVQEVRSLYIQRSDVKPQYGHEFVEGDLWVNGGDTFSGVSGLTRGALTLFHGSAGNTPGYLRVNSANGTSWYFFVEDDGTLKVHNGVPNSNSDGSVVGTQS